MQGGFGGRPLLPECMRLTECSQLPGNDSTSGVLVTALTVLCCTCAQHPWLRQQGVAMERPLDSVVLSRMKKFSAMNKLRKAALLVIAKSLSADEINGLQQLFRSIDADSSGTITVDELRAALGQINGGKLQVRCSLQLPSRVLLLLLPRRPSQTSLWAAHASPHDDTLCGASRSGIRLRWDCTDMQL